MKRTLLSAFLLLPVLAVFGDNGPLVIEGKYQEKNVYVQNAFNDNGVGFCAYEVRVNGQVTTDEVNSSAFEIDLRPYNFHEGDKVEIKIFHKEGCQPKVLNPEALKPRPTFSTTSIAVSPAGVLSWTVTGETGSLPFVVEQFRWSKWVYVGEIDGIGTPDQHTYNFQVTPHSGENKFRVKQVGFAREVKYTPEVTFTPQNMPVMTFTQSKDTKIISISAPSLYEMYDMYGNVVLKGFGEHVDISDFNKGLYYFCFDDQVVQINRK